MANFFISYSRKDSDIANKIRNHILKLNAGHDVFLDIMSLKVGVAWKQELKRKIDAADFVVFILSKNSVISKNIKDELSWIKKSELNTGIRKLLTYRIDNTNIFQSISMYQVLDATDNFTIDFYNIMAGASQSNSFFNIDYTVSVKNRLSYDLKCWVDAPPEFLAKIQLVEFRFASVMIKMK